MDWTHGMFKIEERGGREVYIEYLNEEVINPPWLLLSGHPPTDPSCNLTPQTHIKDLDGVQRTSSTLLSSSSTIYRLQYSRRRLGHCSKGPVVLSLSQEDDKISSLEVIEGGGGEVGRAKSSCSLEVLLSTTIRSISEDRRVGWLRKDR